MRQSKLNYIIALFFIMLIPLTASADDFNVATSQDLQTALSTANGNGVDDIVYLAAGTYTGNFSYQPTESQAITIQPEAGLNPGQVVLDGDSIGRTLLLSAGTNVADMTLERIVIQNGDVGGGSGGGLSVSTAGDLTINVVTFTDNSALRGSAIYLASVATANINNSVFSANGGGDCSGVALYNDQGNTVNMNNNSMTGNTGTQWTSNLLSFGSDLTSSSLTNNTISNNTFIGCYGLIHYNSGNNITITGNSITNNSAIEGQGVLRVSTPTGATILVENNTISNNSSVNYSIGYFDITRDNCTLTINNNTFTNNSSSQNYGLRIEPSLSTNIVFTNNIITNNNTVGSYAGVRILGKNLTMNNNIIADNVSGSGYGGAYIAIDDQLTLTNNTFTGNKSNSGAGGLQIAAQTNTVISAYNNILWGNSSNTGNNDLYLSGTGSGNKNFHYNNIHDMGGTLWDFVSNNIDVDPLFIDSGNDDFHLGAASLCLDVGLNTAPGIPATDLDGNARISNTTVDLGAYEHSTGDFHPADTDDNGIITLDEFTAYGDSWKTTASPIDIDYVTRAGYLLQNGSPLGAYKNIGGGKPLCWVPEP